MKLLKNYLAVSVLLLLGRGSQAALDDTPGPEAPVYPSEDNKTTTEQPIEQPLATSDPHEGWLFEEPPVSKLKIERSVYSALLYQEDEFGLEFLCPGFWLRKDLVLVRSDCWPDNTRMNIDHLVSEIYLNHEHNLSILRLKSKQDAAEDMHIHLLNVEELNALLDGQSIEACLLYVLRDDCTFLERFFWDSRPLPFKVAKGLCKDAHINLRTRVSSADIRDYALVCGKSLVGMQATGPSGCERKFGRLTLVDLSHAKRWIGEVLQEVSWEEYALEEDLNLEQDDKEDMGMDPNITLPPPPAVSSEDLFAGLQIEAM